MACLIERQSVEGRLTLRYRQLNMSFQTANTASCIMTGPAFLTLHTQAVQGNSSLAVF